MSRRIVHVIDPAPLGARGSRGMPHVALLAVHEAAETTPWEHVVVVLGSRAEADAAAGAGLRVGVTVPLPLGEPLLVWRSLRTALRRLGRCEVVQAWSRRSERACEAAGVRPPVLRGPPEIVPEICDAAPGRGEIRGALGIPDDLPVAALLADPPWHADARRFVYVVGLLDVAGIPIAGLIGPGTAHLERARRFHADAAVRWRMLLPGQPASAIVHACDAAVIMPPEPHTGLAECERAWVRWSVARAHRCGVPVIGASEWLTDEVCPTAAREMLDAGPGAVTDVGRRLAALASNPARRRAIADIVREHARARRTRERVRASLEAMWGGGAAGALEAAS